MMKKRAIMIGLGCLLVIVVGVVILFTNNGDKTEPKVIETIHLPELSAPEHVEFDEIQANNPYSHDPTAQADDGSTSNQFSQEGSQSPRESSSGTSDPGIPPNNNQNANSAPGDSSGSTHSDGETIPGPSNGVSETPTPETSPTETQPGEYMITFTDRDNSVISVKTVKEGHSVLPPIPPDHEGAVFLKWDKTLTNIRSDRTIRAVYMDISTPAIAIDNLYIDKAQKTFSVRISIYNNPGLSSLLLDISFPQGIALQKIEFDDSFGKYVTAPEPYQSPQSISMVSPFEDVDYSGVFATLTFAIGEVTNLSNLEIGVSYDQENTFDTSYNNVEFAVLNSTITRIE